MQQLLKTRYSTNDKSDLSADDRKNDRVDNDDDEFYCEVDAVVEEGASLTSTRAANKSSAAAATQVTSTGTPKLSNPTAATRVAADTSNGNNEPKSTTITSHNSVDNIESHLLRLMRVKKKSSDSSQRLLSHYFILFLLSISNCSVFMTFLLLLAYDGPHYLGV
jgi:hypothetical protein